MISRRHSPKLVIYTTLIGALFMNSTALLGSQPHDLPSTSTTIKELRLNQMRSDGVLAILEADGAMVHRAYQPKPDQIVLDVLRAKNPLRHHYPANPHPLVERILMYEYPNVKYAPEEPDGPMARIVFELKKPVEYRVQAEEATLRIEITPITGDDKPTPTGGDPIDIPEGMAGEPLAPEGTDADPGAAPEDISPVAADPSVPEDASIEPEDIDPHLFFHHASTQSESYRMGAEDVLDIRVFELDQLNRTVRVSGDGSIDLPLVGRIPVQGLTADQVSARVADLLQNRYVQDPQVSIFVREFNSQRVSLLGAVKQPATYPVMGRRNLLQLLADAGGLADAGNILYVFRQTEDGRSARLTVPLTELLINGDPRWNIWIQSGDVISVPPEAAISISILGAVNNPGIHKLPAGKEATLLKAIAMAGGLNERAAKSGIQITRKAAEGEETLVKVDLDEILSGKKADVLLKEGDVVVVKESFF